MPRGPHHRDAWVSPGSLGLGVWIITIVAAASTLLLALQPADRNPGLQMWTRARTHFNLYTPFTAEWNAHVPPTEHVTLHLLSDVALEQRMLAGFLTNTYTADLIELERRSVGRLFTGPADEIGFLDLTDRLHETGIFDRINQPSFSPWTSRGRIYGLPHDVHPVLLAYRADLVADAGINMNEIETWNDFERVLRPLIADLDGDGRPDRYLLNIWHTNMDMTECLILQAGGTFFDVQGRPTIATTINANVIARIVSWVCGPMRIAIDAPEFSAAGNQLRLEGAVIASLAPDWLCGVWKTDMPGLAGKVRLIPLPAWTPGGRRTSVWGGSMLGIARRSSDPEAAWRFAQQLYLDANLAEKLYREAGIITPATDLWNQPVYDEPDPYFGGQPVGRAYINAAPGVPLRTSSPYNMLAKARVQDAVYDLRSYAIAHDEFDPAVLAAEAQHLLEYAESAVQRQIQRNVFLREDAK